MWGVRCLGFRGCAVIDRTGISGCEALCRTANLQTQVPTGTIIRRSSTNTFFFLLLLLGLELVVHATTTSTLAKHHYRFLQASRGPAWNSDCSRCLVCWGSDGFPKFAVLKSWTGSAAA